MWLSKNATNYIAKTLKEIEKITWYTKYKDNFEGDIYDLGIIYRYEVFEQMNTLRADADKLEAIVDKEFWPLPTYSDMLFNV